MTKTIRAVFFIAILSLAGRALSAAPDKTQTVSGSISKLDAPRQTVVVKVGADEKTFVWNAETRINGVLAPGARVTIRYATQPDGQNVAYQISVGK